MAHRKAENEAYTTNQEGKDGERATERNEGHSSQGYTGPEVPFDALQAFSYGQKPVRAVEKDGKAWFVAQDLCTVLGLSNPSKTLKKLDSTEKGVTKGYTLGGQQKLAIVNESGALYIIMRSNRPEAKAFRLWVTGVVLPAILRTGSYSGSPPGWSNSPHITLPGPGRYIAEMMQDGTVVCELASYEEAATRIFFAEGQILVHMLKLIQAHWSIVQQSRLFEDDPQPIRGSAPLHQAIIEAGRLASEFLPRWDATARRQP